MNTIVTIRRSKRLINAALLLALVIASRAVAKGAENLIEDIAARAATSAPCGVSEKAHNIRVSGNVNGSVEDVWRAFTTSDGAQEFFAPKANIQLAIGGAYEIFFDPKDAAKSTQGLKILSYAPEEMISFQWSAPPNFPEVRNGGTWVVVQLHRENATTTRVELSHLGWKNGTGWDVAYPHMVRGWNDLMERLKLRFKGGPIDWIKEAQTESEQVKDGFPLKAHQRT